MEQGIHEPLVQLVFRVHNDKGCTIHPLMGATGGRELGGTHISSFPNIHFVYLQIVRKMVGRGINFLARSYIFDSIHLSYNKPFIGQMCIDVLGIALAICLSCPNSFTAALMLIIDG